MNDRERIVVESGSVEAAAQQIGIEAASEALYSLTMKAPQEIQGSWPLVLAWSEIHDAWITAHEIGDWKGKLAATKAKTDLLNGLY